ncbi:DUF2975 domain-containing protein [Flavobacterium sp.]|uniref:DUF2975 domain-containing protein n=1 Tax=Flavobacterium sp. TaxID=239 RepID=UPI00260106BC|nr:DUF2975 domain-containing protein [Flavobacterium sp.]
MKKLNLLKTIVDFTWILSVIFFPLVIVLSIMIIIDKETFDIPVTFTTGTIDLTNSFGKVSLVLNVLNFGVVLYAVHFFRKLLGSFVKRIIFEDKISILLDKIGGLIIIASIFQLSSDFTTKLSKHEVGIEFGYGPFVYLLVLGLFFKVLSEVFKMAINIKEENELTI